MGRSRHGNFCSRSTSSRHRASNEGACPGSGCRSGRSAPPVTVAVPKALALRNLELITSPRMRACCRSQIPLGPRSRTESARILNGSRLASLISSMALTKSSNRSALAWTSADRSSVSRSSASSAVSRLPGLTSTLRTRIGPSPKSRAALSLSSESPSSTTAQRSGVDNTQPPGSMEMIPPPSLGGTKRKVARHARYSMPLPWRLRRRTSQASGTPSSACATAWRCCRPDDLPPSVSRFG